VSATVELTNYLRQRFAARKIYLTGESWGTTLGVLAAQRAPDLYYAFIGSGQMVSQLETDRRLYADVLALATRSGDNALAAKMRAYGEPPYNDVFAMALSCSNTMRCTSRTILRQPTLSVAAPPISGRGESLVVSTT
jgi:pimeloyl-ACP methyl ester carboxylesterase